MGVETEDDEVDVFDESSDDRGEDAAALFNEGTLLLFFSFGICGCLPKVYTDDEGDDGLEFGGGVDWDRASITFAFDKAYISSIARLQSP